MAFRRPKISIIGAGFTGTSAAVYLLHQEVADVVLVEIPQLEGKARGMALDLLESTPVVGKDVTLTGTVDYADTAGSDIVIITAGVPRKPGMSREDLIATNAGIVKTVTEKIVSYSPNCTILVLTNPVDSMTYTAFRASGLPSNRVLGQSGVLDTARYRTFLAQELKISVKDVSAFVLGGHGDDMVPLVRYTYAGGIPVEKLLPKETIDRIVERTRKGGGEIVNLMGTSAGFAPGAALAEMAEAIIKDKRRILPAIAYLDGEYGYKDIYLGVPTVLGGDGLEKIIEIDLTPEERAALDKSAQGVQQTIEYVKANVLNK